MAYRVKSKPLEWYPSPPQSTLLTSPGLSPTAFFPSVTHAQFYALVILNSWPALPSRLSLFRCQGSYSYGCFCLHHPTVHKHTRVHALVYTHTHARTRNHKRLHFMNSHLSFKIQPGKPFQLHRQN